MKRLLIAIVMLLLLSSIAYAESAKELEIQAVGKLYDTAADIAKYGDGINPKVGGKWTEESKTILDRKIQYYEAALTGLKAITDDPAYKQNPEESDYKDVYNKAVTAVTRLESQIAELKEFQNQQMNEDGEVEDSGFLGFFKKTYDNEDLKTKLKPINGGDDDSSGLFGISWWIWGIGACIVFFVIWKQTGMTFKGWSWKGKRAAEISREILENDDELKNRVHKMATALNEASKVLNGNAELPEIIPTSYHDTLDKWNAAGTNAVKTSVRDKRIKTLTDDKTARKKAATSMKDYENEKKAVAKLLKKRLTLRAEEEKKLGVVPAVTAATPTSEGPGKATSDAPKEEDAKVNEAEESSE